MTEQLRWLLYCWMHRRGVARILSSTRNSLSDRGTAYIETRGPRPLARWLCRYALRYGRIGPLDWDSVAITSAERIGSAKYRWLVSFRYRGGAW